MTQFARIFTLSLQKININTLTVEREEESLTESFNNSQTKFKTKKQNKNRVVKPNLSYTDILHNFLF